MLIFTLFMQVYIVSGWYADGQVASTETLVKDSGSAWRLAANFPFHRALYKGVALDHGRFIVAGECWTMS